MSPCCSPSWHRTSHPVVCKMTAMKAWGPEYIFPATVQSLGLVVHVTAKGGTGGSLELLFPPFLFFFLPPPPSISSSSSSSFSYHLLLHLLILHLLFFLSDLNFFYIWLQIHHGCLCWVRKRPLMTLLGTETFVKWQIQFTLVSTSVWGEGTSNWIIH